MCKYRAKYAIVDAKQITRITPDGLVLCDNDSWFQGRVDERGPFMIVDREHDDNYGKRFDLEESDYILERKSKTIVVSKEMFETFYELNNEK